VISPYYFALEQIVASLHFLLLHFLFKASLHFLFANLSQELILIPLHLLLLLYLVKLPLELILAPLHLPLLLYLVKLSLESYVISVNCHLHLLNDSSNTRWC
jgi:hypothetical protein